MLALRAFKTGWTTPLREEYFRWFNTTATAYRGGNTFASSLRRIQSEAQATLSDDERAPGPRSRSAAAAEVAAGAACRAKIREELDRR